MAATRRCEKDGFDHLPGQGKLTIKGGDSYPFCPGKATWYEDVAEIFLACRLACQTGILPKAGSLEDQDADFAEVLPFFADRWAERQYVRVWGDVHEMAPKVLEALARLMGAKLG